MLSDDALNVLMQPIVDRQEALSAYVVEIIAKRVKEIGHLLPSDVYKLERLLKSGGDVKKINKAIAKATNMQVKDIKELIKQVALDGYLDTKPFYDYRHKSFIPFEQNAPLQKVVKAIAKQTADSYINLAQSRAFMIRDLKNPKKLKPTKLSQTYYSVVDEAIQAIQSGAIDYDTAMRRTIKQLADSGIQTVKYHAESGRVTHQDMPSAVKRNILDGVRQINQAVQDETGRQYGADGKEITVHEHSAPDHEPIQGYQFTNEEYDKLQNSEPFKDVTGKKFAAIDRHIGQYNCRHFTYSIIIGVNKPNFTQEQLDENIKRNHKGYTDKNGKHRTLYECTQEQRKMEREIRAKKQEVMAAKASGDTELEKAAKAELSKCQKNYTAFSEACGIPKKTSNCRVPGYGK